MWRLIKRQCSQDFPLLNEQRNEEGIKMCIRNIIHQSQKGLSEIKCGRIPDIPFPVKRLNVKMTLKWSHWIFLGLVILDIKIHVCTAHPNLKLLIVWVFFFYLNWQINNMIFINPSCITSSIHSLLYNLQGKMKIENSKYSKQKQGRRLYMFSQY